MTNVELNSKAMLVWLSVGQWTARKFDKEISDEVTRQKNAAADAGRWNKLLVAKDSLENISKIAGEARTFHYQNTLPWADNGSRLLPAANYLPYTAKMREFQTKFDQAVSEFVGAYPSLIEQAKTRLNGTFKERDYPAPHALKMKYHFSCDFDSLTTASDFRVSLGAEEIKAIQADIETRTLEAQQRANRELWERLHEAVSKMADKLAEPEDTKRDHKIFRDSLVENVTKLCDLLPRLNVLGDAQLENMRQDIQAKLLKSAPEILREDKQERQTVKTAADNILASMSSYMGSN